MMTDAPIPASGFRIRGWHVAVGVSAFFAAVIAVDVAFVVLAYRTFPGQVSVTPYEDGLLYNRKLAQVKAQEELGWRAAAAAEPGVLVLQFENDRKEPLGGLAVTAKLERPATEAGRITAKLRETAPGRYEAPVGALSGGWDVSAEARDAAGAVFALERRLTWPSPTTR